MSMPATASPPRPWTPEQTGQVLARLCLGLPEVVFLGAVHSVSGQIEAALAKAGNDRTVAARLAGRVASAACRERRRLRAASITTCGHA
ncbi:hypothetical protein [Pseudoroseomonas cervicalis]|uniref:hypothetical protein n=1 Tax=Teichococcus cervicalis TaxID=204525 RepID=UPI0022F157A3|nr:hypothetical protein [Pseudoroseomonas cervicalis]WBV44023.1 hypothetical protein PFY06_05500 [Pseudoroseomonas cervicalis]